MAKRRNKTGNNDQTDLMKDLPGEQLEDLQRSMSEAEQPDAD